MEQPKIYGAISAIMSEIGYIGKDKKNQQQGFMFRGIDQVMNTMKPLLAKHGVFAVPEVLEMTREERQTAKGNMLIYSVLKVRHHFYAEDGSEVVSTTIGEGMDSGDKASNKAMAIAFKYACFQVFCIPTEEMAKDDPDNYTPEGVKPKRVTEDPFEIEMRANACQDVKSLTALYMSLSPEMQTMLNPVFKECKQKLQGGNK